MTNTKYTIRSEINHHCRTAGMGSGVLLFLNLVTVASLVIATIACS